MQERLELLWAELVRRDPDAVAVFVAASGESATRRELSQRAGAWREGAGAAARRGDRVIVAEPNGLRWLEVFLGLVQSGAVPAALDPGEPESAQLAIAEVIGARWLCTNGELRELGGTRRTHRDANDHCLIKLTSGTTGAARALVFTHGQMIADGRHVCSTMDVRSDDRNLGLIPFGHSYGLGNLVVPLFEQGTSIVVASGALPHALADDVQRFRPTVFPSVPVVLRALTRAGIEPSALESLRVVISAGSVLDAEAAVAFHNRFGRKVHGFYGSSETGGISYDRTGEASLEGRSVGTPLDGVRLTFRRGGRFWVESAAVKSPGRHSPADRGKLNERGELVLLGRAGRTIKLGGRRVELGEIERALRSLPAVHDAYAIAHPSKPEGLAAAVVSTADPAELRRLLRLRLAPWKIPDRLVTLTQFPTTARGKVDRQRLRELIGLPESSSG